LLQRCMSGSGGAAATIDGEQRNMNMSGSVAVMPVVVLLLACGLVIAALRNPSWKTFVLVPIVLMLGLGAGSVVVALIAPAWRIQQPATVYVPPATPVNWRGTHSIEGELDRAAERVSRDLEMAASRSSHDLEMAADRVSHDLEMAMRQSGR